MIIARNIRIVVLNMVIWILTVANSHSQSYEPVANFAIDSVSTLATMIQGSDGNFYGTTYSGGIANFGSVFKMTPQGTRTIIASFLGANGKNPVARLIEGKDGNFYGTTFGDEGVNNVGTVFKVTPSGILTTILSIHSRDHYLVGQASGVTEGSDGNLYVNSQTIGTYGSVIKIDKSGAVTTMVSFGPSINATLPSGELVEGLDGNFYGTTLSGGSGDFGTIFKMSPAGTLTTFEVFNSTTGKNPKYAMLLGSDGNFYGTTPEGGIHGYGTIFKFTPAGVMTLLANGHSPSGRLEVGNDGFLYGTSQVGGTASRGSIFKIAPTGDVTTTVFSFTQGLGIDSISNPGLTRGFDGNFYGTTLRSLPKDYSTIFKITPAGDLTTMAIISPGNGNTPTYNLLESDEGTFYGTTHGGGEFNKGIIYRVNSSGTISNLYSFNGTNGAFSEGGLVRGADGDFYGTTVAGGENDLGTVFKITPSGQFTTLLSFDGANGRIPKTGLIPGGENDFYGTTQQGGQYDRGTLFKIASDGTFNSLFSFDGTNGNGAICLFKASDGNLYGTSYPGGTNGLGNIFKATPGGTLTNLFSFSGTNGRGPSQVVEGDDGNFYGISSAGGDYGLGTLFRVNPAGILTTLIHFDGAKGSNPQSLLRGKNGIFFGTTGGNAFKYSLTDGFAPIFSFTSSTGYPSSGLVEARDGNLYSTTVNGGLYGGGNIFRLKFPGAVINIAINDGRATLTWPLSASGYTLQSRPSMSTSEWGSPGSSPTISGDYFTLSEDISTGNHFYRLIK
ncbi:MAG: 3-carboxymuconate cyclase [Verrucomicrobiales bacterium]|nr:3-carboxymuconate cyclase [Verrucomicrobiales bacterium]